MIIYASIESCYEPMMIEALLPPKAKEFDMILRTATDRFPDVT